jgi:hypothetical protein
VLFRSHGGRPVPSWCDMSLHLSGVGSARDGAREVRPSHAYQLHFSGLYTTSVQFAIALSYIRLQQPRRVTTRMDIRAILEKCGLTVTVQDPLG